MRIKAAGCIRSLASGNTASKPNAPTGPCCAFFSGYGRSVTVFKGRLFMCPSAEMAGRKGHKMKIRMYYESKLEKDVIVLDVPDDECEVMIENDYRQRLEKARPEDRDSVRRRDAQTIIDEECNKPTYNSHHTETRRHVALESLDPEGDHISDGTNLEEIICTDNSAHLHRAIQSLLPEQIELLRKTFWENRSHTEIARAEGVTEAAIRGRLVRIYERLKEALESKI